MSKLFEKAKKEESENNLKVALTYYEMALSDPSCPFDIRCDMGVVYNKLRNFNEALSCFDNVLNMDENHFNSLFGKGISCLGLNRWDDALDLFLKVIEIDDTNANSYYYISIILQTNGDDKAQEYYSKFLELDNDEFKQNRSYYEFGLLFLNAESELANDDKLVNIKAFEELLNSFGLSDDEIESYLKTLNYNELISKVNELNDSVYAEDEKRIIREQYLEMGFTDKDVDDYFLLDPVDVLKEDIISRTNNNPFPDKTEIDIPLYVEDDKYIFDEININEKSTKSGKNKSKRIKDRSKAIEKVYKGRYSVIRDLISNNDFEKAIWYCDFIDETKISNESFKVNFIYARGLISAYLDMDLNKVLDDFKSLEKDYPEIKTDKNYIHNKINIENNLEKSNKRDD